METLFIPSEKDFKQWVKEAVRECLEEMGGIHKEQDALNEPLLSRKEIAVILDNISLVTLTDWMKRGLPYHKQRGRVYFLRSEVMTYIKSTGVGYKNRRHDIYKCHCSRDS
jgi:hypothetical protein